jgi:hypothetical protein
LSEVLTRKKARADKQRKNKAKIKTLQNSHLTEKKNISVRSEGRERKERGKFRTGKRENSIRHSSGVDVKGHLI